MLIPIKIFFPCKGSEIGWSSKYIMIYINTHAHTVYLRNHQKHALFVCSLLIYEYRYLHICIWRRRWWIWHLALCIYTVHVQYVLPQLCIIINCPLYLIHAFHVYCVLFVEHNTSIEVKSSLSCIEVILHILHMYSVEKTQ